MKTPGASDSSAGNAAPDKSNGKGENLRSTLLEQLRWVGLRHLDLNALSEESLRTFREQMDKARVLAQGCDIDGCQTLLRKLCENHSGQRQSSAGDFNADDHS